MVPPLNYTAHTRKAYAENPAVFTCGEESEKA